MGKISDAYMDATPLGEPDADVDDHQLNPFQSTAGPTETAHTGVKNAPNLPTDTRTMQPLRT